jgi:hypothetical protein
VSEFNPLDQQFLPAEHVRKETVNMLANLELEIHRLRMQGALAGSEDVQAPNAVAGVTIAKAIVNLQASIEGLKMKFDAVLNPDAGTQQ